MRLFTSLFATLAVFAYASMATAALNVAVSSADDTDNLVVGQTFTIDIGVSTTAGEATALGLRAVINEAQLDFVSAVIPNFLFHFSPAAPFGGIANQLADNPPTTFGTGPEDFGFNMNLFQGVSTSAAPGTGTTSGFAPQFSVTLQALAPGTHTIDVGAFSQFADIYLGGDGVANNASFQVTVIPEPGTALLMGLGLAGLATAGRRD